MPSRSLSFSSPGLAQFLDVFPKADKLMRWIGTPPCPGITGQGAVLLYFTFSTRMYGTRPMFGGSVCGESGRNNCTLSPALLSLPSNGPSTFIALSSSYCTRNCDSSTPPTNNDSPAGSMKPGGNVNSIALASSQVLLGLAGSKNGTVTSEIFFNTTYSAKPSTGAYMISLITIGPTNGPVFGAPFPARNDAINEGSCPARTGEPSDRSTIATNGPVPFGKRPSDTPLADGPKSILSAKRAGAPSRSTSVSQTSSPRAELNEKPLSPFSSRKDCS